MTASPQNDRQQANNEPQTQNPFFTAETDDSEAMARWMLACQDDDAQEN